MLRTEDRRQGDALGLPDAIDDVHDAATADQVRRNVEAMLREPLVGVRGEGDAELAVSAAVGLALYPGDGHNVDALIARADADMYTRKAGKGRRP
mgnify:CR=1 FL=1